MARTWLSVRVTLLGGGTVVDTEDAETDAPVIAFGTRMTDAVKPGEDFRYVFDFGDDWVHRCSVEEQRVDPVEVYGIAPRTPAPYFGWGTIPDQYGRRWESDDGSEAEPPADASADPMLSVGWPDVTPH